MSLRNRLHLLVVLLALAVASTLLALQLVNRDLRRQLEESRGTAQIVSSLSTLRYLSLEFRNTQGDRVRLQWHRLHRTLSQQLAAERNYYADDRLLLFERVQQNHALLARLFAEADVLDRSTLNGPAAEHQERLVRQIVSRIQYMIDDFTRLSRQSQQAADAGIEEGLQKLMAAFAFLVLLLALLITSLYQSILRPLDILVTAARAISKGQSGVRLPARKDADFGTLFQAFNEMIGNLENSLTTLQEANRALLRSNQDLSRFAYVASHDLQAPLRGIAGFVQLIEADYGHLLDDEGRTWLKRIQQSTGLLQATIRDLLNYSRIDQSTRPFEKVELGAVVDAVRTLLDATLRESGATLEAGPLPAVLGDEVQLSQLFQNLLSNAIKFRGEEPPVIRIESREEGDRTVVRVQDNGIGIPPAYHERVFEMFQRLHPQNRYPGTGIGLSICQLIMKRHSAHIRIESDGEHGTTFILDFPQFKETQES